MQDHLIRQVGRPAAQYLRMSTEHQRYSLENQAAAIGIFAALRGFHVVRTYTDAGKSGVTLARRDGLKSLLADVLAGGSGLEAILVLDISRWGRFQDPDQAAHYEFLCRQAGVSVHYCAEPFENDLSLSSSILKHMKRVMAGEYSRELSEKVRRAKRRLAALGFKQSGAPTFALARILVDPAGAAKAVLKAGQRKSLQEDRVVLGPGALDEVAVVRRIFRLFVSDQLALAAIAHQLNTEGAPLYRSAPWDALRVRRVLRNPIYAGTYEFGRSRGDLGKVTRVPAAMWVRSEVMEPIVDKSVFAEAQRLLQMGRKCRLTDRQMLDRLLTLKAKNGKITAALMTACRDTPGPDAYISRFGSLRAAYVQIGWRPRNAEPRAVLSLGSGAIIAAMTDIFDTFGFITLRLLQETEGCPTKNGLEERFGSVWRAYALAGYQTDDASQAQLGGRLRLRRFYAAPSVEARLAALNAPAADGLARERAAVLQALRSIVRRQGRVTQRLIKATDSGVCIAACYRLFGSVGAAYFAAGIGPEQQGRGAPALSARRRHRRKVSPT